MNRQSRTVFRCLRQFLCVIIHMLLTKEYNVFFLFVKQTDLLSKAKLKQRKETRFGLTLWLWLNSKPGLVCSLAWESNSCPKFHITGQKSGFFQALRKCIGLRGFLESLQETKSFSIAMSKRKQNLQKNSERKGLIEDQSWPIPIQQSQWYKSGATQVTWAWINFIMFITTASFIYRLLVDRRFSVSKSYWGTLDVIWPIWPLVCDFFSVKLQNLSDITFSFRRNASRLSYGSVSPRCTSSKSEKSKKT